MFKKLVLTSVLTALISVNGAYAAQDKAKEAPLAFAAVNIPYVMNEIPQAKETAVRLQKEFAPREQEIMKLEDKLRKLDTDMDKLKGQELVDAQRKFAALRADYQLKTQAFKEDNSRRVNEENIKLGRLVQSAIDSVAKERGLQLVLRGEAVVYATGAADISKDVISRVKAIKDLKAKDKK